MSETLPIHTIVDPSVAITGAFIAARNMARALAADARFVLVLPRNHAIPADALRDFHRVETIPMVSLSKSIPALLCYLPALLIGTLQLKARLARDGAQHLILNDFYLMHGALLRLLGYHGRITSWVRCNPAHFAGPLARPMLWLINKTSDRRVAVSAYLRGLLPRTITADILYEYYAGPTRTPRTWAADEPKIFLYIANYIRGKGQEVALAAFAQLAENDPTVRLHFHGGDMGLEKNRLYRHELVVLAEKLGLTHRVTFGDFLADTFPALETAFAALNFSASESFSMTVLEACGAGVPVIATQSGGPAEIIANGTTGYLIPVGDVAAATARMQQLTENPATARSMGEAAANHIHEHFSAARFRTQLLNLLAPVASR